jgi:hypothetical protein
MYVWIIQGLAFALALGGFLAAAAVEHRFQSYLSAPKDVPAINSIPTTVAAE